MAAKRFNQETKHLGLMKQENPEIDPFHHQQYKGLKIEKKIQKKKKYHLHIINPNSEPLHPQHTSRSQRKKKKQE